MILLIIGWSLVFGLICACAVEAFLAIKEKLWALMPLVLISLSLAALTVLIGIAYTVEYFG